MPAAARAQLIDLRQLLAERFPPTAPPPAAQILETGIDTLDLPAGGGLPKGAITEVVSPQPSAGSATLIAALLQAAYRDAYFIALVDGRDSFDVEPVDNACLRRLLWARCANARETMQAADLLVRDGNFPLVIVDLVLNPVEELRKIPATSWYRMQRLAETSGTALLVLSRQSMVASAQLKLVLENSWDLADFERADPLARLHIHVQRAHRGHRRFNMEFAEARAS